MLRVFKRVSLLVLFVYFCFFGCSGESNPTPLELTKEDMLTSYAEMMEFIEATRQETQKFTVEKVASSVEGRDIVLIHFAEPESVEQNGKIKVLLFAQQHGNEPSGKEALLRLIRDISAGRMTGIMDKIDLYIIPQVNIDGGEMRQRRNANDKDLNRDHLTLTQPEVLCVHEVFQRLMPEVTLDLHEYGRDSRAWREAGMLKNFGSQMGAISNPNIPMSLRTFCWNRVLPFVEQQITQKDMFFQRYLVVSRPDGRFRFSTTALNDGRNSLGIYNTLSFLVEGMRNNAVEENIHERERQQYETVVAFLDFFAQNAEEAKRLVQDERTKATGGDLRPDVSLVMDYVKDPAHPSLTVKVQDAETGEIMDREFPNYYPLVQTSLSVQRPQGYAIPTELTDVIDVLKRHKIIANESEKPIRAAVETYRIKSVTSVQREDKDAFDIDVDVMRSVTTIPEGYYIVWCDQLLSNLVVSLLEPQSQWGLTPLPEYSDLLRVGSVFPVKRIMKVLD